MTIIYNPVSGAGRARTRAERMERALDRLGIPARLEPTDRAGDGTRIAAARVDESRALVAVGGDGTVREVAAGMPGEGTPLVVLPAGTSNVLALALGLPTRIDRVAQLLTRSRTRYLDTMEACREDEAPVKGMLFLGAGFGAAAVHRLHQYRRRRISRGRSGNITKLHYLVPLFGSLYSLPTPSIQVWADGEPLPGGPWGWVLVTNISRYAGDFLLDPDVHPDDGLLDVIALKADTPYTVFRYLVAGALGLLPRIRGRGRTRSANQVRLEGQGRVPIQIDGDPGGELPLTVRRERRRIPLLVPPLAAGRKGLP